ncbi:MAG: hypothetical protein JWO82_3767 [Akkermansiaceae bacterium]|nr:hypothetical protein [Akkermansiaceae bacterium]
MKALNDRQRRFCEALVTGMAAGRAYEAAGYDSKGNVADTCAEKLLRNAEVQSYLKELRKPLKESAVLTRQSKREILAKIATGKIKATPAERARAIQIDNAMTGDNQPIKIEGELTLKRVLEGIDTGALPNEEEEA